MKGLRKIYRGHYIHILDHYYDYIDHYVVAAVNKHYGPTYSGSKLSSKQYRLNLKNKENRKLIFVENKNLDWSSTNRLLDSIIKEYERRIFQH
jgi:hypothetical protein